MTQTNIIQSLCDLIEDENILNDEEYKKWDEESTKWYKLLDKYIKADKKLFNIFYQYDMAEGLREGTAQNIYFREGFLCGARLMLGIFGYDNKNTK